MESVTEFILSLQQKVDIHGHATTFQLSTYIVKLLLQFVIKKKKVFNLVHLILHFAQFNK